MRRVCLVLLSIAAMAGCRAALSPEVVQSYQNRTLYTCCNIHYEGDAINDANYYVGATIPLGTPVHVVGASRSGIIFTADGTKLTLSQDYGREQESFQKYIDKVLVTDDPKGRVASFSRAVQDAIREGRVERNMTKEQVILSLGYPPTHRTASTTANEWTYWYNRWVTYKVEFDDTGRVSSVVGRPAPTQDQPIPVETPKPAAAPLKKRR